MLKPSLRPTEICTKDHPKTTKLITITAAVTISAASGLSSSDLRYDPSLSVFSMLQSQDAMGLIIFWKPPETK
jgi:hypothetical protein